ncbi:MAG: tryptophan synthase subunit alpha [Candidatus Omnitrophica bacterium]|jgi:tryptophan synthase alpha chain|nr:tryptophan synthase subunit alpha [Candidatus Omnitrophota bacterium]
MNRIDRKFKQLRKEGKKAFIAFLTAGYPDLKITGDLILAFEKSGVDIIEIGVPFSDPIADGPVIQEASQKALEGRVNLDDIFALVKKVRAKSQVPICLMTYYNPVFSYQEERFVRNAHAVGVDGLIVPDLPCEEAGSLIKACRKYAIDTIFFASPTTKEARIQKISSSSRGFIYYVSTTGVTGARKDISGSLKKDALRLKRLVSLPVCVGFGISTPKQVKQVSSFSDGVIIGSAIVKKIKENSGHTSLVKKVSLFVRELKGK